MSKHTTSKELRKGITTGASAAAAAQAAVIMLFQKKKIEKARLVNLTGKEIMVPVKSVSFENGIAEAVVVKDGGDDYDITHGLEIVVKAYRSKAGIKIVAGEGIGRVTKPGLQVSVGEPAINPVPRQMITSAVESLVPEGGGVRLEISVPGGEEVARKTLNPKLGIIGGISILGTTGIVEPMSEEAFKQSLVPQISIALAHGHTTIFLTPGRLGERWVIEQLGVIPEAVVQMSNFVGYMLKACAELGIKRVILAGHHSKISKVAAGCFHTHSRVADARMEVVAAFAGLLGANVSVIKKILEANTSDEAYKILVENKLQKVMHLIAERAAARAQDYVYGEMKIGVVMFDMAGNILACDTNAVRIGEEMQWLIKSEL